MWAIGEMYIEKSTGPRTEPWGTPQMDEVTGDEEKPTRTELDRPDIYELSQL